MKRLQMFCLSLLWPAVAHACAVCGAMADRNRGAFFGTTMLLSLLPLGMIGGGVWWLRHNSTAFDADDLIDRDADAPPPGTGTPARPGRSPRVEPPR